MDDGRAGPDADSALFLSASEAQAFRPNVKFRCGRSHPRATY